MPSLLLVPITHHRGIFRLRFAARQLLSLLVCKRKILFFLLSDNNLRMFRNIRKTYLLHVDFAIFPPFINFPDENSLGLRSYYEIHFKKLGTVDLEGIRYKEIQKDIRGITSSVSCWTVAHTRGNLSSCVTCQPIPSKFSDIRRKIHLFTSVLSGPNVNYVLGRWSYRNFDWQILNHLSIA